MDRNLLIMVRHSLTETIPGLPSEKWELSAEGRKRCITLAERINKYQPALIITSMEPKAIQTGALVANILGIPFESAPGLHEHLREKEGLYSQIDFEAKLKYFFEEPSSLVFGQESAKQALSRFSIAIAQVLDHFPTGNVVIVAHGTVMALWVAGRIGGDPFTYWKKLGLPSFAVFSRPDLKYVEFVENVT